MMWCAGAAALQAQERPDFASSVIEIVAGAQTDSFTVEVAASFEERRHGLMFVEALAPDHGMLFVFPDEGYRSFWMRNTLIPLDILFFDAAGGFVNRHDAVAPLSLDARRSSAPAQYVLEVNGGVAAARGWGESIRLVLPPALQNFHMKSAQ